MPSAKLSRKSHKKPAALEAKDLELAKLMVRFRPYETVEGSQLEQFKKTATEFSQITGETKEWKYYQNKIVSTFEIRTYTDKCVLQAHFV